MTFCKFGDLINIRKSNEFIFSIDGPFSKDLSKKNNIILDAVSILENFFNLKFNIEIILTKNLPIASGMGGGSSNAATIVYCLINLYNLKIKKKDLNFLLFSLGADVPFCFYRKSAFVRGKGERIKFIKNKIRELPVILINPLVQVSTKSIFENLVLKKNINKFKDNEISSKNFLTIYQIGEMIFKNQQKKFVQK